MPIGWIFDLASGEAYFEDERLATDCWDAWGATSAGTATKEKALLNAYNRILYSGQYPLIPETYAEATADQLVKLRKAQCEMAYYLCQHMADEDRRKGLQAQAVKKAGIVQEDYSEPRLEQLPIPPFVDALLAEFKDERVIWAANVERDEDKDANEKVHEF